MRPHARIVPTITVDDVLVALPSVERPARLVVRAAQLYLGSPHRLPLSTREVARHVGVAHSTIQYWMRRLGIVRSFSQAAVVRLEREFDEVDTVAICRAYQACAPVQDILDRHQIHLGRLYGILDRAGVPRRTQHHRALSERDRLAIERRRLARDRAHELGYVRGTRDTRGIKRQIARELGVSRRSVEDYLAVSP